MFVSCRENFYFNSSSFYNSSAELVAEARGLRGGKDDNIYISFSFVPKTIFVKSHDVHPGPSFRIVPLRCRMLLQNQDWPVSQFHLCGVS